MFYLPRLRLSKCRSLVTTLLICVSCNSGTEPLDTTPPDYVQPYLRTWHARSDSITSGYNMDWSFSAVLTFEYRIRINGPDTLNIYVHGPVTIYQNGVRSPRDTNRVSWVAEGKVQADGTFFLYGDTSCCDVLFLRGSRPRNDTLAGTFLHMEVQRHWPEGTFVAFP